jgi:hypothetical protein
MKYSASLLAAAGLAAAQSSTVVNVFLPAFGSDNLVASVISAGPDATSYRVSCPTSGADSDECGLASDGLNVLYGPSTLTYGLTLSEST